MKHFYLLLLSAALLFTACQQPVVPKPKKIIDEKKMTDILYDVAILEGIKQRMPGTSAGADFIYKKYGIDSLQLAQNNQYYASDIERYERMYNAVNDRIDREKHIADSLLTVHGSPGPAPDLPDAPMVK